MARIPGFKKLMFADFSLPCTPKDMHSLYIHAFLHQIGQGASYLGGPGAQRRFKELGREATKSMFSQHSVVEYELTTSFDGHHGLIKVDDERQS
ncbi:Usherin [Manis pentadactyla]|nr:Usherin [Manis pentadactyla]